MVDRYGYKRRTRPKVQDYIRRVVSKIRAKGWRCSLVLAKYQATGVTEHRRRQERLRAIDCLCADCSGDCCRVWKPGDGFQIAVAVRGVVAFLVDLCSFVFSLVDQT